MDEETLTLGRTEQKRVLFLNQLLAGLVTGEQAATLRGRSPRQVQRLKAAYQARGAAAVVHGNRGRTPAWTTPTEPAARIVALAQGPYAGFNQQHLTEVLAEREGVVVSRSTARRLRLAGGIASVRPRRRSARRALTQLPAPDTSSSPRVCTPAPVGTGAGVSERMRRG